MEDSANQPSPYVPLAVGDPAPWFRQRCTSNPNYCFDLAAGRYVVLCFFVSAADALGKGVIRSVLANRDLFDDERSCFFGVSHDPGDERERRVSESMPGLRFFWDSDGTIGHLYGALPQQAATGATVEARRFWMILDPTLRIMAVFRMTADNGDCEKVFAYLRSLPPPDRFAGTEIPAPVLVLPNVFEPSLCRRLTDLYEEHGGAESGIMKDINGKTVPVQDHRQKRRRDYLIEDADLIKHIQSRIIRRINPELKKIYAFESTRMERYIVGCYAAEDSAHFKPHRDNTTRGTAHRRFAVSINLNEDFEGGEVSFPEYGRRGFKMAAGGAVVFPCALLHAVAPVTRGRRFAFLPFLYDEAAAKTREANNAFLQDGLAYHANPEASAAS